MHIGLKRTALIMGVAATITVAQALPANAAVPRVYQGRDYASWSNSDGWLEVCDMERDGHGVYGEFYTDGRNHKTVYDMNGSRGGCGNAYHGPQYMFRVCEAAPGPDWCSGWVSFG